MRAVVGVVLLVGALWGCSDTPCAQGERKVGSTCFLIDGGTEEEENPGDGGVPGSTGFATPADAGSVVQGAGPEATRDGSGLGMPHVGRDAVYICPVPMQCAEWPMPDDQGKAKPSYALTNETVTDNVTKLIWERRPSPPTCEADGGLCTQAGAFLHCAGLTVAGRSDWRLPSAVELQSIFSLYNVTGSVLADPFRDDSGNRSEQQVWTSDRADTHEASVVRLSDGRASLQVKAVAGVRCVAGGEHRTDSRYTVSNDGEEVADNWTTLVWRRAQEPGLYSFDEAKIRCANLGNGWRMPTAKELLTLVTPQVEQICIDPRVFTPPTYASLWSDTAQQVTQKDGSIFLYHLMVTMNVGDDLRCGQVFQEIPSRSPRVSIRCVR